MKVLILGAGQMATGLIFDMLKNEAIEKISVVDQSEDATHKLKKSFGDKRIDTGVLDISYIDSVRSLIRAKHCVVNATHYKYNHHLSQACIEEGVNFCDMGGNVDVVERQFSLNAQAKKKEITIIPDCGLAPGMVSIAVVNFAKQFDELETIKIRVGGVPQKPKTQLNYQLVFSVEGLINEYVERALILDNGKEVTVDSMTGLEELFFSKPFGKMEAFYTSGGTSTLPKTFYGKVKNLDYKTVRYPGHCELFKFLLDLGFAKSKEIDLGRMKVVPRELFGKLLESYLPGGEPDAVLVKLEIEGKRNGKRAKKSYELIDLYDEKNHLTSMQRMTAFPVSIIAQMLAAGRIKENGVLPQEIAVPSSDFMMELEKRGIKFSDK